MTTVELNDFTIQKECIFEDERYSVRNNGAVLRHIRPGKRARANDNQWTYGIENNSNAYLHIAGVRVHRIVATAFHGDPPDPKYVVDHIDTNCRNNRPENLRWLTRLENALKNPVTRKKIEYLCGSIEAFLENPSMLNEFQLEPNYSWMRGVTKEEAQNTKKRMEAWAAMETKSVEEHKNYHSTSFTHRVYKPVQKWEIGFDREPGLELTNTFWCATYMFRPSYFPCCPREFKGDRLEEYFQNIRIGEVFAHTEKSKECPEYCFSLIALDSRIQPDKQTILVLCERSDQKFVIVGISLCKDNGWFIHFNLGVYNQKEDAEKAFTEKERLGVSKYWDEGYNNCYT